MKHFLYLEDKRITYIHGRFTAGGFTVKAAKAVVLVSGNGEDLPGLLRTLGLAGKLVTAAVGGGETMLREMRLPAASARTTRKMICNEIARSRKAGVSVAADMDILGVDKTKKQQHLMACAIERERLKRWMSVLREAGISCTGLLTLPDCVAKLVSLLGAGEKAVVVAALEPDQLRLYLVKSGHCLLNRNLRLNVNRFRQAGAEALLYEEAADQIQRVMQYCEARTGAERVEQVLLMKDGLSGGAEAGAALSSLLNCPCSQMEVQIRPAKGAVIGEDIHFGALALCAAGSAGGNMRPVNLLTCERESAGRGNRFLAGGFGTRCILFAGVNILAVAVAWIYLEAGAAGAIRHAVSISASLEEHDGYAAYEDYQDNRLERERLRALQRDVEEAEDKIRSVKEFGMADYQVLWDSLGPGMAIEAVTYDGEKGLLEVRLSFPEPGAAPDYVERVRESGRFQKAAHSAWRYETGGPGQGAFYLELTVDLTGEEEIGDAAQ